MQGKNTKLGNPPSTKTVQGCWINMPPNWKTTI